MIDFIPAWDVPPRESLRMSRRKLVSKSARSRSRASLLASTFCYMLVSDSHGSIEPAFVCSCTPLVILLKLLFWCPICLFVTIVAIPAAPKNCAAAFSNQGGGSGHFYCSSELIVSWERSASASRCPGLASSRIPIPKLRLLFQFPVNGKPRSLARRCL